MMRENSKRVDFTEDADALIEAAIQRQQLEDAIAKAEGKVER